MNDWQPTMQLREVWLEYDAGFLDRAPVHASEFVRIECLYRHLHTGETEWRPIPRVEV